MKNNRYKVFFTISFVYSIDKKKSVTKFFKSDVDIDSSTFEEKFHIKNESVKNILFIMLIFLLELF